MGEEVGMAITFGPAEPEREVALVLPDATLEGTLVLPPGARGVVLFAHGSGSGRRSPRNRLVAGALQGAGLGTLLFDLLTPGEAAAEAETAHLRFDLPLLSRRLVGATDWLAGLPEAAGLPIGYFGASTGGGAALMAAAERPGLVAAVVSRGGRPDLAGPALQRVEAPTLLVVGGLDATVLALNEAAARAMRAPVSIVVVPGATHLFEEPGKLEAVAALAAGFFERHLGVGMRGRAPTEGGKR